MKLITIDNTAPIIQLANSLSMFAVKPYLRVVIDPDMQPKEYLTAIRSLKAVVGNQIFIEPIDSEALKDYSLNAAVKQVSRFIDFFANDLFAVEVGNEINGVDWTGKKAYEKTAAALKAAKDRKIKTIITYYLDGDDPDQMFNWIDKHPKLDSDYVLISYYPREAKTVINNLQPYFDGLHQRFPNAKLGMGEFGDNSSSMPPATQQEKIDIINRYYKMVITTPNYIGLGGYWNYVSDVVQKDGQLNMTMVNVFKRVFV